MNLIIKKLGVATLILVLLSGYHLDATDANSISSQDLVIKFPKIQLAKKERIVSFDLYLGGYWVTDVRNLPRDWDLRYDPSIPTEVTLKAAAQHGVGALNYGENLNVEISLREMPSYETATDLKRNIRATVYTTDDFENTKEYWYEQNALVKK